MRIRLGGAVYEHDRNSLLNSEAILVKRKTAMTVAEWQQGLVDDDPEAIKALLFLLKLRAGEDVEYDSLDFDYADLEFLPDGDQEQDDAPKEAAPAS